MLSLFIVVSPIKAYYIHKGILLECSPALYRMPEGASLHQKALSMILTKMLKCRFPTWITIQVYTGLLWPITCKFLSTESKTQENYFVNYLLCYSYLKHSSHQQEKGERELLKYYSLHLAPTMSYLLPISIFIQSLLCNSSMLPLVETWNSTFLFPSILSPSEISSVFMNSISN